MGILLSTIRLWPVPRHIAFIMDGNRRYAQRQNKDKKYGHEMGWKSLEAILEWCLNLGVKAVTVYAFSIQNFQRDQEEVEYLFEMVQEKLKLLVSNSDFISKHKIRIKVLGKKKLLPKNVLEAANEAEQMTMENEGPIINVCIPYSSTEEIQTAAKTSRTLEVPFEECLYTAHCPPVDMLFRTSGEQRLSDFLLWQVNQDCKICFLGCSWPELKPWHLIPSLIEFAIEKLK